MTMLGWPRQAIVSTSRWNRFTKSGFLGQIRGQNLERHDPLHAAMPGLEDGPHAARAQPIENVVVADAQGDPRPSFNASI